MAEKRMFTKKIVDSDDFLDLPLSAQALYFHLNMEADDDGFINNPRKIQRGCGASENDLNVLLEKRFILGFDNGTVVVKHWRMNNTLRKDRYKPTQYIEQLATLEIKEDGSYTEKDQLATKRQPNGNHLATQYSIDKNSIDKVSIGKESIEESTATNSPLKHYGTYNNVLLSDDDLEKLKKDLPDTYEKLIDRLSAYMESTGKTYKNHFVTIKNWAAKDMEEKKTTNQSKKEPSGSNPFLAMAKKEEIV